MGGCVEKASVIPECDQPGPLAVDGISNRVADFAIGSEAMAAIEYTRLVDRSVNPAFHFLQSSRRLTVP